MPANSAAVYRWMVVLQLIYTLNENIAQHIAISSHLQREVYFTLCASNHRAASVTRVLYFARVWQKILPTNGNVATNE